MHTAVYADDVRDWKTKRFENMLTCRTILIQNGTIRAHAGWRRRNLKIYYN